MGDLLIRNVPEELKRELAEAAHRAGHSLSDEAMQRLAAVDPELHRAPEPLDLATLQAVLTHRYHVATSYARSVKAACASELDHLRSRAGSIDLPSPRDAEVATLRAHGMLAVMSATIFIVGSLLYRRYAPRAVEYI